MSTLETVPGPIRVLFVGRLGIGPSALADDLVGEVEPALPDGPARVDAEGEEFHCVVMRADTSDGLDRVAEIAAADPSLPILVVTDQEVGDLRPVFEAGAADVVRRAGDWPPALEHRIRAVVTRRRYGDPARSERIVETVDDGIYTLDEDRRISWVNEAAVSMLGYSREELVGAPASRLTADGTLEEASRIGQDLLNGEREVGRLEAELETASGEAIPIETQFTMMPLADGEHGQVGVFRDITERATYEQCLEGLHDSTRSLLRAQTRADVGQIVRETAAGPLDSTAAVFCYDGDANVLRPSLSPPPALDGVPVDPDDGSPVWRSFVEETVVTTEADGEDDPVTRCYPLAEHGVLVATGAEDGFDERTDRLMGLLAASTEAALDRISQANELRERDRELEQRNDRLVELNRINEVIREIDRILVQAESREEIEAAVCEQLTRDDRWAFGWIGEPDAKKDELVPRAWAGGDGGYLDGVDRQLDGADEPAVRAARRGEPVVVSNVAERFGDEPWRKGALSQDFQSVVSVPVHHGDLSYGVLTVYARDAGAFGGMTEDVFGELGHTIAHAINSVETVQGLLSDHTVELDLRIDDEEDLLVRLAQAAGSELEFVDFVPTADGETAAYFTASGVRPERVVELGEEFYPVGGVRHVADRDGDPVFEATIRATTVANSLRDYGAATRLVGADERGLNAVIELPRSTAVREFVERLRRRYPSTTLVARRNRLRSSVDRDGFRSALEDALTDRQLEVFRTAYRLGYFEWPRRHSGQDVAAKLGISQPTFNRHIRESQRKLVDQLFGDDE